MKSKRVIIGLVLIVALASLLAGSVLSNLAATTSAAPTDF